jgi:hypothetical protein
MLYASLSYSQQSNDIDSKKNKSIAFYYGQGVKTGFLAKLHYNYKPTLYILEFKKELTLKKKTTLSMRFSAEYNSVSFYNSDLINPRVEYQNTDYGANISFDVSRKISENSTVYSFLGTGPHYLKTKLARQAKGFIFSDVLAVGLAHNFFNKKYFVDLRYCLRHLSNAGSGKPNVGIDNHILNIGIGRNWN